MSSFVSRNLEYLLLAVLAILGAVAVAVTIGKGGPTSATSATTATPAAESRGEAGGKTPPCQDLPAEPRPATCRTRTARLTIGAVGDLFVLPDTTVRLTGADAVRASTPEGRQRRRMRVTVTVALENTGTQAFSPMDDERSIYLAVAGRRIAPDAAADDLEGALALDEQIEPGETGRGTVRFELAGTDTDAVLAAEAVDMGVEVRPGRIAVARIQLDDLGR